VEAILKSKELQGKLDELGFVKFKLLSAVDLIELEKIYARFLGNENLQYFTSTNIFKDVQWREEISKQISAVIFDKLSDCFQNVKLWNPAFLIKPAGENTEFKMHQDWTFVNEDKFVSGNIWMPLTDTDELNGTLYFIPRSHYRFINTKRYQGVPYFFDGNEKLLKEFCIPITVKAGEAVVFYHSIIHYTPPNLSQQPRAVVASAFNSAKTGLSFFLRTGENFVEEYSMPDNYVFYYENTQAINSPPKMGQLVRRFNYNKTTLSENELLELFSKLQKQHGNEYF
jgi:Phytanoyl-CoA dioxygenase (PhyH)